MRNCEIVRMALLGGLLLLPAAMIAQKPAPPPQRGTTESLSSAPAHDLSGMWEFFNRVPGQGIYATPSKEAPPMTAWGRQRFEVARPGYGPRITTDSNDPILHCDPVGIPRALFYPQPFG